MYYTGVGYVNIYAQTYAVTGGVLHYIGAAISSTANSFVFNGVGNTVGMNQGDLLFVGIPQGRATMAQTQVCQTLSKPHQHHSLSTKLLTLTTRLLSITVRSGLRVRRWRW
jgi:hypothetical protein